MLEVNNIDTERTWDASGLPDQPQEASSSQRFRSELASVLAQIGLQSEPSLLKGLARGNRPVGRLKYAAIARVYSHLRPELPLEYLLEKLGISLHAVSPALKAEGVYDDEPVEAWVSFAMRRTTAPHEARQTCEQLIQKFPAHSRRHLVAAALAEWVGEERSAWAVGLRVRTVILYNRAVFCAPSSCSSPVV